MEASKSVLPYIPVDYLKAYVLNTPKEKILDNSILNFVPVYAEGGELRFYRALHQGLKIKVYESGTITFAGSLHKYWNFGKHNYNDFPKTGFDYVVSQIRETLGIEPENLYITTLEIGVNIIPPIATAQILNNIFLHKERDVEQQMSNDKAKFHCIDRWDFQIKLYDKSLQYDLPHPLLRVEVKYSDWKAIRDKGIVTLADFMECDKTWFRDNLLRCWNELLFYDPTAQLPGKWDDYSNQNYWRGKRRDVTEKRLSRAGFSFHVKKLRQFNETGQGIQGKVATLIDEKLNECANT